MEASTHIVDNQMLRILSGKRSASAVRRWANRQGIRTLEGVDGPWTTQEAINWALGVRPSNEPEYHPEDII